jgi:hypothetical protein
MSVREVTQGRERSTAGAQRTGGVPNVREAGIPPSSEGDK